MKYKQLTPEERYTISSYRKTGLSVSQIAKEMDRHRSTIYREVKRHLRQGAYRPSWAVTRALTKRSKARRGFRYSLEEFDIVRRLLRRKWSPEQISGTLKRIGLISISHETIYKYIWWDKSKGGKLYKYLRQSSKKRRKRYRAYDSRGLLAGKRHISERPDIIDERARIGDWEIDTVMGSGDKHCIVTLVERKTGYTLIGKLNNRTKEELNRVAIKMIMDHKKKMFTITADNGTEFHGYSDVEKATAVAFYFATAYHSWERGTNENTNGLIRQYLPKRKSMAKLTQNHCNRIAYDLNTRPRKRLQFNTPWNRFWGEKNVALQS
jgi:IS30 family transposase